MKTKIQYMRAATFNEIDTITLAETESQEVNVICHEGAEVESLCTIGGEQFILLRKLPERIDIEQFTMPDAVYHNGVFVHIWGKVLTPKPIRYKPDSTIETVYGNGKTAPMVTEAR